MSVLIVCNCSGIPKLLLPNFSLWAVLPTVHFDYSLFDGYGSLPVSQAIGAVSSLDDQF